MNVQTIATEALSLDPANARKHNARNIDAIKASLKRFGQQKPIVVDAQGVVRDGNGTLEAARALGWESIAVVNTALAGTEAAAYAIAANRTAELANWDETALAETLRALQSEDFPLDAVGFDDAEVDRMLARMANEVLASAPADETAAVTEAGTDQPSRSAAGPPMLYPLAIVLDRPQLERWKEYKANAGQKSDAKAFVLLLETAVA